MTTTYDPVKVVVLNPLTLTSRRTFCFIGDAPRAVINAVESPSGKSTILQEYFGREYKQRLGIGADPETAFCAPLRQQLDIDGGREDSGTNIVNTHISTVHDSAILSLIARGREPILIPNKYGLPADNVYFVDSVHPEAFYGIGWSVMPAENQLHVIVLTPIELWSARTNKAELADMIETMEEVGAEVSMEVAEAVVLGGKHSDEDQIALDDIESQLNGIQKHTAVKQRKETVALTFQKGIEYISDIHLYPEDKVLELKDKIYLATEIPVYRQHLFYMHAGAIHGVYKLSTDGVFSVDIRQLPSYNKAIFGIPIDKYLYDNRHNCKVESEEVFTILDHMHMTENTLYVVDLAQFTAPSQTSLRELLGDAYQFELFYYGFIIKYWPQLTTDVFRDYILDEKELEHKYPDLAKSYSTLSTVYRAEREIVDLKNKQLARVAAFAQSNMSIAITQMTAVVAVQRVLLNIRNLFDKLRVTRCIPEIHAYLDIGGKKYLLRKRHIRAQGDIIFPSIQHMKTGIIIACSLRKQDQESFHLKETHSTMENEQSRYLFLCIQPNGKYLIRTLWNEEDEFAFADIMKIMKSMTDPLINGINQLSRYVFVSGNQLPLMTTQNTNFQSMNICVFWKKVMLETTFKVVKTLLEPYTRARITGQRNVQQFDKYEFSFRKGTHEFDQDKVERIITQSNQIQLMNYYSYLSNNTIKQKWDQNYDGRVVRMSHRTTDIRFEIADIRESEFAIFYTYICDFCFRALSDVRIKQSMNSNRDYSDVKKLRKLREQDPELFNLKKYGGKKTYSILCQNKHQPLIYTPEEIKNMSAQEVKKLTQYWNFTLNKPAFYGCPEKEYPHLSFMVGDHPKNYCLPCCAKKSQSSNDGTRKQIIHAICKRDHVYSESESTEVSRHVIAYGKTVDVGRLSKIPQAVINLTIGTLESPLTYYLIGTPQYLPGADNLGAIFSIAECLNTNIGDLVKRCIGELRKDMHKVLFNTLLGGTLTAAWDSMESLLVSLNEIFIQGKMFTKQLMKFTQWPELFIELLHVLFHVCVFTFIDESAETSEIKGTTMSLYVPNILRNEIAYLSRVGVDKVSPVYIILCKRSNYCYPMMGLIADEYFKTLGLISHRTWDIDHPIIKLMFNMVSFDLAGDNLAVEKTIDLAFIKDFCEVAGGKITLKFINRQNLCYAVGITLGEHSAYIPIDYSAHIADGTPITFAAIAGDTTYASVVHITDKINSYINEKYLLSGTTVHIYSPIDPEEYLTIGDRICGFVSGKLYFYFNDCSVADLKVSSPLLREIGYNYPSVNALILSRAPPVSDPRTTRIGEALYTNYLYQLYLIEFVYAVEQERNIPLRKELIDLITNANFKKDTKSFRGQVRTLLKQYPQDYSLVRSQIDLFLTGTKADLIGAIESTTYEFDKITMAQIAHMDRATLKQTLIKLSQLFCVEKLIDPTNIQFPNVYMPCAMMTTETGYCTGKKLIVDSIDTLADLLTVDLLDPLKRVFILSGIYLDTTINMFKFTQFPTEIISVYRLD